MSNYRELQNCWAGGGDHLVPVLNLGQQTLTGVSPRSPDERLAKGPPQDRRRLLW
jgi:hypothetical protein